VETAALHAEVEQSLNLLRPGFGTTEYCALLKGFYGIFAAWEPAAQPHLEQAVPGFFGQRRKLQLIQRDFLHLGISERNLPLCESLSRPSGPAEVMGSAYVFEGSTLGGQILTKHFRQRLGVTPQEGCAFFFGYGSRTGEMWRQFGSALDDFAASTGSHDEIVERAGNTFSEVRNWLYLWT
jgi:heme oxygenase